MDFLPVFLDIRGQCCLVVGGGDVAARKVAMLLRAQARAHVVAPKINASICEQLQAGEGSWREGAYQASDLNDAVLVVAATDDMAVNRQVHDDCRARRLPVNVADNPGLCSFVFPSIIDRSPVVIAVSSAGKSPVLARLLRARLETTIPATYGRLADICGEFRRRARQTFSDVNARRAFWEKQLQGNFAELVFSRQEAAARDWLEKEFSAAHSDSAGQDAGKNHRGEVYLVGAGPGDPDLLTFRALRLMQQADVVVYDKRVSSSVLDLCRRDADFICAEKYRSQHEEDPQENIHRLLIRLAQQGKRICRLKVGDFDGSGGEIEELTTTGVFFQVAPGVTIAPGA